MTTVCQNWDWLYTICCNPVSLDLDGNPIDRNDWKFCPSKTGEPWVSYAIASHVLRVQTDTIRKKAVRRHPVFTGLVLLTDFDEV